MNHIQKVIILLILAAVLLASCGPVTAVPSATATFTEQATATATLTSTPSPTSTPFPTATLSQVDKIFVRPTPSSYAEVTPAPLATPAVGFSSAKLRSLSGEDALALIDEMNRYSYQYFPPLHDWYTDSQFVGSQTPVALAIQEYLYRFPDDPNADRLRWQLAFYNSIRFQWRAGNQQYGDEWILNELQERLNRGEASPDQLESILEKYWFDVAYFLPIENLFSDGKTGWLYVITTQEWEEDRSAGNESFFPHGGLFFAVREVSKGKFQLLFLNSAWSFPHGESSVFEVSDHNQNGIPEIALYAGNHSGGFCDGKLLIYEWRGDAFVELTGGALSLTQCPEYFVYSQTDGIPSIEFLHMYPASHKELFIWDGNFYKFSGIVDATPLDVWRLSWNFSYGEEAELLKKILASGEGSRFGPAYPDYLRYRLGVAYAFQSKRDDSIKEFQDLVSSPIDPTRNIFPNMARKFMEAYTGDVAVYTACLQSLEEFGRVIDMKVGFEKNLEILGFSSDAISNYAFPLCDEEDAFALMVSSIPLTIDDLLTELRKNGVALKYSKKLDLNLDGRIEEWIIDYYVNNGWSDSFLVFPSDSHYQATRLGGGLADKRGAYSSVRVTVESWGYFQSPVMIVLADGDLNLWKIDGNYTVENLVSDYKVRDYIISGKDAIPQVQIFYTKPQNYYPELPWEGNRWDTKQNEFASDLLEYTLFVLRDPQKAVKIIERILPLLNGWKNALLRDGNDAYITTTGPLPYLYYLAGLSYELSGDSQKAAQIYWQLWHDYPDSPYAIMARYKLEPLSP